MGYEQRIRVRGPSAQQLDTLLRTLEGFVGNDEKFHLYGFRRRATGEMPDAYAALETDGIYFCDNGIGAAIFSDLLGILEERFGDVLVEEV
jgi:hypothetical protein